MKSTNGTTVPSKLTGGCTIGAQARETPYCTAGIVRLAETPFHKLNPLSALANRLLHTALRSSLSIYLNTREERMMANTICAIVITT